MTTTPYIHFEFDTKKLGFDGPFLRLYPLVCMHVGSPQCDVQFLTNHLKRIEDDPNARWVYMGDGGECVTKLSKGDLYGQLLPPAAQMAMCLDLLSPIAHKGLFGIRGNHGHRIYKEVGLEFDQFLCANLKLPYLGVAAFANVVVNRSSYDCFFHHGIDSGITLAAKINKAESFGKFVNADALFTAHSHIAQELTPVPLQYCDNISQKTGLRMRHQYICGCSYDSRTGYAEDKGYPPLLPAYLHVQFDGRIVEGYPVKRQETKRYASDGQHDLLHDYLDRYLNQRS